jgi:endonuclease YncB( thermonuclease family)
MDKETKQVVEKYLQKFYELAIWVVLLGVAFHLWRHPEYFKKIFHFESTPEKTVAVETVEPVWQGSVVVTEVLDGATVQVQTEQHPKVIVRLAGIDAPVLSRNPTVPSQPLAEESQAFLEQMVKNRAVTMSTYMVDSFKRPVVVLTVDNEQVNLKQVTAGLVELYFETLKSLPPTLRADMEKALTDAKKRSHGIWGLGNYESPAAYRIRAARQDR